MTLPPRYSPRLINSWVRVRVRVRVRIRVRVRVRVRVTVTVRVRVSAPALRQHDAPCGVVARSARDRLAPG